MNALAYGHDIWATQAKMGPITNAATIPVAMIPAYTALGVNRDQSLTKAATENDEKKTRRN
jgi:hypothetical protein